MGTSTRQDGRWRWPGGPWRPLLLFPVALAAAVVLAPTVLVRAPAGAAVGQAGEGAGPADRAEGTGTGTELYRQTCLSCHGADGRGSWRGPSLESSGTAGTYYMVATGRMPIDDVDAPVRRRPVPYTEAEVLAIVAYVGELVDGPEIPDLDGVPVDLSLGGRVYRLQCSQCHSATGIGGALLYGEQAPALYRPEPLVVASVVVSGPGAMPAFALTDEELASVVAYVDEVVQDPVDEGGLPLLRAGRVDEGLLAWGLGLVGLALVAGWIARPVEP